MSEISLTYLHELQHSLNTTTGFDTFNAPNKLDYVFQYCQALLDEVTEAKNCFNWKWWAKEGKENPCYTVLIDPKNYSIELIDMMHFLFSLNQLIFSQEHKIPLYDIEIEPIDPVSKSFFESFKLLLTMEKDIIWIMFACVNFTSESCYSNIHTDPNKIQQINVALKGLFNTFSKLLAYNGMTREDACELYLKKIQVNINRQNNSYSVVNKTEDDNNSIKSAMN